MSATTASAQILIYLPPQDLLLTKLLSRTFYSLITYSTALVYQIECFRYGVADVNSSSAALPSFPDRNRRRSGFDGVGTIEVERITVAEKLERLREREKGWDRLDGSSKEAGRRWTQFTAGERSVFLFCSFIAQFERQAQDHKENKDKTS